MSKQRPRRGQTAERLPKDLVLLQLAMVLLSGGSLSYARLTDEYLLSRRTAERYLRALRQAGLPVEAVRVGREAEFRLSTTRTRTLDIEAVDIPPAAARSLSLLLVAAALLPSHLGVRAAVDATVRAALRLRGMKAAAELRRLEDAVMVLENDAKDYAGMADTFGVLLDATIAGHRICARYRSPSRGLSVERFFSATIGLYRGGLYALAVGVHDDGARPIWRAVERFEEIVEVDTAGDTLPTAVRLRALDVARSRWGPARPRPDKRQDDEQVVTLHFSPRAAPYVLARRWHDRADIEAWDPDDGGGARMAIRLRGDTSMFETWVKSWGPEVQVLRPLIMAERIAEDLEAAAQGHRDAAMRFDAAMADDG